MEFFLRIDGQSRGPLTHFEVVDLLRSGAAAQTTPAWTKGMAEWGTVADLPAFEGVAGPRAPAGDDAVLGREVAAATEVAPGRWEAVRRAMEEPKRRPQPWTRFWARGIDVLLFTAALAQLAALTGAVDPQALLFPSGDLPSTLLPLAIPALWALVEALLLATVKTTPGKALLNIHLSRADGGPLRPGQALRRSLSVCWRGWGFGLLPVMIVGFLLTYLSLSAKGRTPWDLRDDLVVEHRPLPEWRMFAAAAVLVAAFMAITAATGPLELPER